MSIIVSTITPCFRMKKYLKKFLEDLPNQTIFENLEVVLDHNEPDEEEISWVKDFQERYPGRLKHIIVKKVDPIGASMNRCIKEASGDYVVIWNVDDLRTPNSLELQYNALKSGEFGIAYGNFTIVRSFGATKGSFVGYEKTPESEFTRSMVFGPFFMFRKSLVEKAGYFDEQLTSGADFDLEIRLAYHAKAKLVSESVGYYLNEGKGASTRPNSKQALDRTVIELRYGILDKIDYDYIADTATFNIPNLLEFGSWNKVEKYVPDYKNLLSSRKDLWFKKGIRRYISEKIFFKKQIRNFAKKIIKKYFIKFI